MENFVMDSSQADYKMTDEEQRLLRVTQIRWGIVLPMVVKLAIDLDLFDTIANAPVGRLSSDDLASNLPTQNPKTPILLDRVLRFLVSQSILTVNLITDECGNPKKLYGIAPLGKHFVSNQEQVSLVSSHLLNWDKVSVDSWFHLKDALLDGGIAFSKAHNSVNAFEYQANNSRFNELFNKSMYDETRIVMKMILEKYTGFDGVKELVDVGGGFGATLGAVVSKYPNIKGVNFDQPHVVRDVPPCPGVENVGGDMFQSVPKGDVILMKCILHDWGDDYCIKLLKNCWAALPECGKVVVVEAIIPDLEHQPSDTDVISQTIMNSDMIMLLVNSGGKERTAKEFDALAREAGFASCKIICRVCTFWVMEFYKN